MIRWGSGRSDGGIEREREGGREEEREWWKGERGFEGVWGERVGGERG